MKQKSFVTELGILKNTKLRWKSIENCEEKRRSSIQFLIKSLVTAVQITLVRNMVHVKRVSVTFTS